MHPTIIRGRSTEFSNEPRFRECDTVTAEAGAGSGARPREDSSSIAFKIVLASSFLPTDSSQRGDSGRALRKYQTTSAPRPPSINMARQPNLGMTSVPTSPAAGKPVTTKTDMPPSHLPRACGGMNSVSVEYPTTFSAPSPTPIINRSKISTPIEGANAAATDASPKIARLAWYVKRLPYLSPRNPVRNEPSIIPRKVAETNWAFWPMVENPLLSVAPRTVATT